MSSFCNYCKVIEALGIYLFQIYWTNIINDQNSFVDFPALDHIVPSASPATQEQAARDLIKRLVPAHADKFMVSVDASIGPKFKDTFKVH